MQYWSQTDRQTAVTTPSIYQNNIKKKTDKPKSVPSNKLILKDLHYHLTEIPQNNDRPLLNIVYTHNTTRTLSIFGFEVGPRQLLIK